MAEVAGGEAGASIMFMDSILPRVRITGRFSFSHTFRSLSSLTTLPIDNKRAEQS